MWNLLLWRLRSQLILSPRRIGGQVRQKENQMEEALRIIIAKCNPHTAEEAIRTMAALRNNSPVLQIRYLNVLQRALADESANWTPDERLILAEAVEVPETGATRDFTFRLRLTDAERSQLQTAADETGQTMSEYVRRKIF